MRVAIPLGMMSHASATEEAILLFYFIFSKLIDLFKETKTDENETSNFSPSFGYK